MLASEMNTEAVLESSTRDQETVEEEIEEFEEERLQASERPLCLVHIMLSSQATLTTQLEDNCRRINIFHTRVAYKGKAPNVINDNGSGLNVIYIEDVEELYLHKEKQHNPYSVS